jgi:hypothetical protein
MNKTSVVTCPLSRRRALILTWADGGPTEIDVRCPVVDAVNAALAANSDQYLYSPENRPEIHELAVRLKDSKPNMNVSGFGPDAFADIVVKRRLRPR